MSGWEALSGDASGRAERESPFRLILQIAADHRWQVTVRKLVVFLKRLRLRICSNSYIEGFNVSRLRTIATSTYVQTAIIQIWIFTAFSEVDRRRGRNGHLEPPCGWLGMA